MPGPTKADEAARHSGQTEPLYNFNVQTFPTQNSNGVNGCWKKRSSTERILLILLLLVTAIAIAMVIVVATRSAMPHSATYNSINGAGGVKDGEPGVCLSPDCILTAARLLESMDQTVDPCVDFFEYACGTWNKKNVIPDDRANINTFGVLRDELQVTLKGLLEAEVAPSDPDAVKQSKWLYQSCLNMSLIEERGIEPLNVLLAQLGGWPVLDPDWDESTFDLEGLLAKLRLLNNRILINQWVSSDDRNSSVNIIQLDQAQLGMPSRDYYLRGRDDRILLAYQTYATRVAQHLGADKTRAEQEMADIVDLEIKLANITTPDVDRRDTEALYHKITVEELYTSISNDIDWLKYLNLVFANVSLSVNSSEEVVVYAPVYLQNLAHILSTTPTRTLVNYMIWRIVNNRVTNLQQEYLDLRRDYNKVLIGTASERARWRTCVSYVNNNFGMAVGRLFIEENFKETAKNTALEMIQNIRNTFVELFDQVEWMDEETKKVAKEKADAIQEKIGYPDYILNDTALSLDLEGVSMHPDRYFENVLNNLNTISRFNLKVLREPVDKSKWSTTPAVVNAFYSATKNQIMFPAGIFQPPFYHESYPKSMNFGGITVVIGHEITHGFDDKGRQFDKDGNLKQWWSDNVIDKFKQKAQCMIDQYGNYTIPEINMNLNGRMTQGENIADNGGLKQAFNAYRKWVSEQGREEDSLPGVQLTNNQLFFLNFAQIWCGSERPQSYLQAISTRRHSPGRFRVIGPLSNSYDFAKAYSCPAGSPMNPVKKCAVW